MITSFVTRGLQLMFGYVYPAYECYKSVELNKPDIDQLRFWCQYWILVAGLTVCEKIGDTFIGWVPMYGEAKLAFFIYLWFPKTQGTTYVYNSFFKPYVEKHEPEIDRNLLELRTRAGDMAVFSWQKIASYGQTRIFDILQYIASQSPQEQRRGARASNANMPSNHTPKTPAQQSQNGQPTSNVSLGEQAKDRTEVAPSEDPKASGINDLKTTPTPSNSVVESSKVSTSNEVQVMQVDTVAPAANENPPPPPQDMIVDEAAKGMPRLRPRRTRSGTGR